MDDVKTPDFSLLPDMIWVNILSNLPLVDRRRVAQTCHLLHEAFNHPSLWSEVKVELYDDENQYEDGQLQPEQYNLMIDKFGHCIQSLHLVYISKNSVIASSCLATLEKLSEKCRLHTLIFEANVHPNRHLSSRSRQLDLHPDRHLSSLSRQLDLQPLLTYLEKSTYLKTFVVKEWPIYPRIKAQNLMEVLKNNKNLHGLEKLSLYSRKPDEGTWANNFTKVPSSNEVLELVCVLRNLKSVHLRSCMLSDALIFELASHNRAPIDYLSVLVIHSDPWSSQYKLPTISSTVWSKLRSSWPEMRVAITVMNRIPLEALTPFLRPEIPVHAVNFMRYARCNAEVIHTICERYHNTLQTFTNYTDACNLDEAYINMVTMCENLTNFVCYSKVHVDTVLTMARAYGSKWTTFTFLKDSISNLTPKLSNDEDNDVVIAKNAAGGYYIVYREREETQESEDNDKKLLKLSEQVSALFQYKWMPIENMKASHDPNFQRQYHVPSRPNAARGLCGRYIDDTDLPGLFALF